MNPGYTHCSDIVTRRERHEREQAAVRMINQVGFYTEKASEGLFAHLIPIDTTPVDPPRLNSRWEVIAWKVAGLITGPIALYVAFHWVSIFGGHK